MKLAVVVSPLVTTPSLVAKVGVVVVPLVLYTIPLADTFPPPIEIEVPPLVALLCVTALAAVVVTEAAVTAVTVAVGAADVK